MKFLKLHLIIFSIYYQGCLLGDSFQYNTYNNHGIVGLINMPTARFYNETVHGLTIYDGTPDQKITMTSNPYNWFEASFFYTNIQGRPYPGFEYQDYKDKGFNIKLKIKDEGLLPVVLKTEADHFNPVDIFQEKHYPLFMVFPMYTMIGH